MSTNVKKIQIQSVIYNNQKESLLRAVKALKKAVQVYHKWVGDIAVNLVYGDASPNPVFSENEIKGICELTGTDIQFGYDFFGCNTGTAKGHNILAQKSNSDYILIMNPDVILEPGCLVHLMKPFVSEEVAMTEARQTPLEHAKEYDKKTGETEWASTACAVFRKSVYDEIEGFDAETFFMYCDDLDFSWRIRLAGYKIIYIPSAIVYHAKNLSIEATWLPTKAEVYYSAEAAILLAYKWSEFERAEYLETMFRKSCSEEENKVAAEFARRKKEGKLPSCIDSEHKIAKFIGDEYCEMRFKIGGDE